MALYFFKPVVWNSLGYQRPSGAKFTSGYPAKHGFGHEEWNNSDRLEYIEKGRKFRIFHTEGFGKQPLSEYEGRIFVFMIASHKGKQYLVSVAGQATCLLENEQRRNELVTRLHLDNLWKDLLKIPSAKQQIEVQRSWKNECGWLPTWTCPANSYLALKTPLLLVPRHLTGRHRLITMYNSYQEIDATVASRVLALIPPSENPIVLSNLKLLCGNNSQDAIDDLTRIEGGTQRETTKRALIDARLGQGKFREDLDRLWKGRCAVSGCSVSTVLRASHVKPWRYSSNKERLDPQNGLLLGAHFDALFDAGLISFDDSGTMLVSTKISQGDFDRLRLGGKLARPPSEGLKKYLRYHRSHIAMGATRRARRSSVP